jgi:glycosyltransferase involved in cell wall biosynthesis
MHWTYPIPIEMEGARNIYTIHDLIPLRLPYTTLDRKRRYLKMVKMIGRRADHIVTVSETSKADILEIMDVPEAKVTNTYQAVQAQGAAHAGPGVLGDVASTFGLVETGYFLFFGAIEPKKNVRRLIEAFLAADVASPLLIVGKKAWKFEQELRLLPLAERQRRGAQSESAAGSQGKVQRILQLDHVPRSILINLIKGARALVFPSIYEGFGLPVLEAMQLGVPVITSNTSSLPEVAGDAALLVDPYDPADIAAAIRRVDAEAGLRNDLAARGRERAKLFSTEIYETRLCSLYGGLVERHGEQVRS